MQKLETDDHFRSWFSGFMDGEGSFLSMLVGGKYISPQIHLTLRADDLAIILRIQSAFGGSVHIGRPKPYSRNGTIHTSKPYVELRIARKEQVLALVHHFDAWPLFTKKAADFMIWRDLVLEYQIPYDERDLAKMGRLRQELMDGRVYQAEPLEAYLAHQQKEEVKNELARV